MSEPTSDSGAQTPDAVTFNGMLRDELLNDEIFETVLQAKVLIERWRNKYNTVKHHSPWGYRPRRRSS